MCLHLHWSVNRSDNIFTKEGSNLGFCTQAAALPLKADLQCFSLAKEGKHQAAGWPNSAYGVSKIGVTAMCKIQQRQFDAEKKDDIIVNAVSLEFDEDFINMKAWGYCATMCALNLVSLFCLCVMSTLKGVN